MIRWLVGRASPDHSRKEPIRTSDARSRARHDHPHRVMLLPAQSAKLAQDDSPEPTT